jgi:DNA-binding CsgD family transcriptional regulator
MSVRPLLRGREGKYAIGAHAIVFVRDPLSRSAAAGRILRDMFGFTEAEANVAQALQTGVSLTNYARARDISLNTVYTHLRRIKERRAAAGWPS